MDPIAAFLAGRPRKTDDDPIAAFLDETKRGSDPIAAFLAGETDGGVPVSVGREGNGTRVMSKPEPPSLHDAWDTAKGHLMNMAGTTGRVLGETIQGAAVIGNALGGTAEMMPAEQFLYDFGAKVVEGSEVAAERSGLGDIVFDQEGRAAASPTWAQGMTGSMASMIPYMGAGMAAQGGGGLASRALRFGAGIGVPEAVTESGGAYNDARGQGGSNAEARSSGLMTALLNLPLNVLTDAIAGPTGESGMLRRGLSEGFQEYAQSIISGAAAQRNPDGRPTGLLDTLSRMPEELKRSPEILLNESLPALLGSAIFGAAETAGRRGRAAQNVPSSGEEDIRQAAEEMTGEPAAAPDKTGQSRTEEDAGGYFSVTPDGMTYVEPRTKGGTPAPADGKRELLDWAKAESDRMEAETAAFSGENETADNAMSPEELARYQELRDARKRKDYAKLEELRRRAEPPNARSGRPPRGSDEFAGRGELPVSGPAQPAPDVTRGPYALDTDKVRRANDFSALGSQGDSIANEHRRALSDIDGLNISDEEKSAAKGHITQLASEALDAATKYPSVSAAGPARYDARKGQSAADAIVNKRAEMTRYLDELRNRKTKSKKPEGNAALAETLRAATREGQTELIFNGTRYYRDSARGKGGNWKIDRNYQPVSGSGTGPASQSGTQTSQKTPETNASPKSNLDENIPQPASGAKETNPPSPPMPRADAVIAAQKLVSSKTPEGEEARRLYNKAKRTAATGGASERGAQKAGFEAVVDSVRNADEGQAAHFQEGAGQEADDVKPGRYNSIPALVKAALSKKGQSMSANLWVDYADISPENARKIKEATGIDVSGYTRTLTGENVIHIATQHGPNGRRLSAYAGQIPVTASDLARLPEILSSPDSIEIGKEAEHDNLERIVSKKLIGNSFVVVEEVRRGRKKLVPVTMWKEKAETPPQTSETFPSPRRADDASAHSPDEIGPFYDGVNPTLSEPTHSRLEEGAEVGGKTIPPATKKLNVKDDVRRQLAGAGESEERADAVGDIISSAMTTFAAREGLSPEEFYERLGLKFVRGEVDPKTGKTDVHLQAAYHGTPYRGIEKMSLEKIGAGEGAQVYGWGIYSAEDKSVAEWYRRGLTKGQGFKSTFDATVSGKKYSYQEIEELIWAPIWIADTEKMTLIKLLRSVEDAGGNIEYATKNLQEQAVHPLNDREAAAINAALEKLENGEIEIENLKTPGQLYRLEVPESDTLLDFDKPLSEQPEKVKEALRRAADSMPDDEAHARMAEWLYDVLNNDEKNITGGELYTALESLGADDESSYDSAEGEMEAARSASLFLDSLGIPGLQYWDGTSRRKGEGSHNFVVWNEDAMEIMETYYQRRGGEQTPRGSINLSNLARGLRGENTVTLSDASDASTLLHEPAHLFRELMRIQAEKFADDAQLQADWKSIQEYGDHEQFAKGFVEYVDTGQAPNSALARAFTRFKQWLAELWSTISRSEDTAALSEEMRGVFGRILAGDSTFQTDYGHDSVIGAAGGGKYEQGGAISNWKENLANDAAAWSGTLDEVFAKDSARKDAETVDVMTTPLALNLVGADVLPLRMSVGKIRKISAEHQITPELMKQMPDALADPVMIFASSTKPNALVVMTELRDKDGATVIVPVHLARNVDSDGKTINWLASIYGKTDAKGAPKSQWFISQIRQGHLKYIDTKKSSLWLSASGLQLPKGTSIKSLSQSLPSESDLVKLRGEKGGTFYQSPAQVNSRTTKSGVEVRAPARDKSNDTGPMDLLNSPNVVAERHAKFRPFYRMAKDAYERQEKLRADFSRYGDKIWGKPGVLGRKGGLVSEAQRETFSNILIQGDFEGKVFSAAELREMGAEDKTIQAYRMIRALYAKARNMINGQRTKYGKEEMSELTGYVPHFFHSWRVMKGGQILDTFRSMREAARAAEKMGEKGLTVAPFMDDFGGQAQLEAVTLGDTQYFKLVNNTKDAFDLSAEEARVFLDDVAKMRNRSRVFKNAFHREGASGWDTDMEYAFRHYMNYTARYVAMDDLKHKGINLFERVYGRFGNDHKGLARYTKDYLNDCLGVPSQWAETMNNWVRDSYLGQLVKDHIGDRPAEMLANDIARVTAIAKLGFFNPMSAAMNFTQLIGATAKIGYGATARGMAECLSPTARTKALYREAGITENITAENPSGYSNAHNLKGLVGSLSMGMFRLADGSVRKATFLGAYRKARAEGQGHAEAMEYAKEINDRVNFDYSVADAPNFMRRTGPVGTVAFQFKKFPVKMLEFAGGLKGMENVKFWVPMLALSGLLGLPGFDMLKDIIKWFTGGKDIELETKKFIGESSLPAPVKRTLIYGLFSNAGVDVGRRAGMGDFIPSEWADLTGPTVSTIGRVVESIPRIFDDGNFYDTLDAISPGLSNPIKAFRGTKDARGREKFTPDTKGEVAARLLGARPLREAAESDAVRIANYETQKRSSEETAAIDAYLDARERHKPGDPEYRAALGRIRKLRIDQSRILTERKKRKGGSAFERKMKEGKSQKARERRESMSGYTEMWR